MGTIRINLLNFNAMKMTDKRVKEVKEIIANHKRVIKREDELFYKGYTIRECPMGSGGVGQIVELMKEIRIQIGYGHGRNNYAKAVIFEK